MENWHNTEEYRPFRREIYTGKSRIRTWVRSLITSQEAFVKSLTEKLAPVEKVKTTLKRRVGYMQEKMSITRAKLEEMEISEDKETSKKGSEDIDEEMDESNESTTAK